MSSTNISDEERIWGFIAWLLSIVGAVLALLLKPGSRYVRYWSYLSISFFIVLLVALVLGFIVSFIPIISFLIDILIKLSIVIVYIIGITKSLTGEMWQPPIIYGIATLLGIEKI